MSGLSRVALSKLPVADVTLRTLLVASLLAVWPTAEAVDRGDAAPADMPHRVMAVGRWNPSAPQGPVGPPWGPPPPQGDPIISKVATSVVIDFNGVDQRCMLTSGQAVTEEFGVPAYHRTVMGHDVRELRPEMRDQLVAGSRRVLPDDGFDSPFRDLRVNWLELRQDHDDGDARIQLQHYDGMPIAPVPSALTQPAAAIYGYGDDSTDPAGYGILRSGAHLVGGTATNTGWPGGAVAWSAPQFAANPQGHCDWDIGGPLDTPAYGVFALASLFNTPCDTTQRPSPWYPPGFMGQSWPGDTTFHAALNSNGVVVDNPDTTLWADVGNWEQVVYLISEVCTKEVNVHVVGGGTVHGNIIGQPLDSYDTDRLDHDVECHGSAELLHLGLGDCLEAVHQPEDLELFVEPDDGWYFAGWTQPTPVPSTPLPPQCPCSGPGPSCILEFDDIGKYTPEASSDVVHCIAEFERVNQPGGNTGGTVPM